MLDQQPVQPFLMGFQTASGAVEWHMLTPSVKSLCLKLWQEESLPSPPTTLTGSQISSLISQVDKAVTHAVLTQIQEDVFANDEAYDAPGGPQLVALATVKATVLRMLQEGVDHATEPGQVQSDRGEVHAGHGSPDAPSGGL